MNRHIVVRLSETEFLDYTALSFDDNYGVLRIWKVLEGDTGPRIIGSFAPGNWKRAYFVEAE